jgi:NAD(P)H dehydrogenase (quinone)
MQITDMPNNKSKILVLGATGQVVIGQPFSYEARPPEEFYRNVLAAGAEPAYMKCVFDSYTELTNGTAVKPDEVFDNLPAIIGRPPRTLADFAKKHADKFRY